MRAVLLLSLISISLAFHEIQEEDGLLIFTDQNFDTGIKQNPYILVEFYAPWCGHCKTLAPELIKAAKQLIKEHIRIAKIDATVEKRLASRFQIKGYPTLKFFRNGKEMVYDGKRTAEDIVQWLHVMSVPLITKIENHVELDLFKQQQQIVMIYLAKGQSKELDFLTFENMADKFDGVYFGSATSQELRHYLGLNIDEKIVLFVPWNQVPYKYQGEISKNGITDFVHKYSFPDVFTFNMREQKHIETLYKPSLFLILDSVDETSEEVIFKKLASQLKKDIIFTSLNKNIQKQRETFLRNKIYERFGVRQYPSLYIWDNRQMPQLKYKFEGEFTEENVKNFIEDWKNSKLKPFYKSQKVPLQRGLVKEIVGISFDWEVIDQNKDVFLMYYSSSDQYSRKMFPVLDELAKKLQVNPNIVIGRFDATENEVAGLVVSTYPSFKLIKKVDGKMKLVDFYGTRTVEGILQFLKDNTAYPWVKISNSHDDL